MKLVGEFPSDYDQDDMYEVTQACKKISGVPGDAFDQFEGAWRAEWSSRAGSLKAKKTASLKMKTFNTLPSVKAEILGQYFRVAAAGGAYERVDVFTLPGADGAQAALVLAGPWTTGSSEGNWGEGAERTRCGTDFQTVRVALPSEGAEASRAMLEGAGLAEFLEPRSVTCPATYVDLDYISPSVCVTKDEAGSVNVLTRLSDPLPFALD